MNLTSAQVGRWLPARPQDSHKGDFGHVLVVAGSRGMAGAVVLAGRAALRSGAGLVTLAVPQGILPAAGQLPEALALGLPESRQGTLATEASGRLQASHRDRTYRVLALGPGLGFQPETAKAVVAILGSIRIPAVVDADGLNNLSAQPREAVRRLLERRGAPCIVTPHPGEMARLLHVPAAEVQSDRIGFARKLSVGLGAVCVLKGRQTVITDGNRVAINPTGNPGLAKGGSGDALTGIIAALWSQRLAATEDDGFEAAALGVYLHGLAADIAARGKGTRSLLATDVIEALPHAFGRIER